MFTVGDLKKGGIPVAMTRDSHKIIKLHEDDGGDPNAIKIINSREVLQPFVNNQTRVFYIAAPSGSGKSVYTSGLVKNYLSQFPKEKRPKFILISKIEDDPAFKNLHPVRINIEDEGLIETPLKCKDFSKNSIIVFDDVDAISDDGILASINKTRRDILENGRHRNLKIVITSHLILNNNKPLSRTILNESQVFTFFPRGANLYYIRDVLKRYLGYSNQQIDNILEDKSSRWLTITSTYPGIVIREHQIALASEAIKKQ